MTNPQTAPTITIAPTDNVDTETGSHDKFTHIVAESWTIPAADSESGDTIIPGTPVIDSFVNGTACRALCGKVWVANDNPHKYPLCPACVDVAKAHGWSVPTR